jgi:hypothetical protein
MKSVALVLAVLVLALAGTGVILARTTGGAHSNGAVGPFTSVRSALEYRLHSEYLDYRWVLCVPQRAQYHGHQLSRCNVNFGEPHIVPYCAALVRGRLVTDHENHALNCGARLRGEEQDSSVHVR